MTVTSRGQQPTMTGHIMVSDDYLTSDGKYGYDGQLMMLNW